MATVPMTHQRVPGPRALPLLGWRASMLTLFRHPFEYMRHLYDSYGDVVALAAGDPSHVFAFGPELNFRLLSNPDLFHVGRGSLFRPPKGTSLERLSLNNLLQMNGEHHMQQRRLMLPAFHKKQIVSYHSDMIMLTQQLLDRWQTQTEIELNREMRQLTQRIAVKTLFGLDNEAELLHVSKILQRLVSASLVLMIARINLPGTPYARILHAAEQLEDFMRAMIAEKRSQPEATDVLAALVHAHDEDGTRLSDDELIGHTFTLFVAGHETTSNALTWTLFLLNQHPHVCTALLDELDGVLHGAVPTVEQLQRLPLLEGTLKESLRLMPPAIMGIRIASASCELGAIALPAGATIFYSQFVTHRLPELYQEPDRFKPERWLTLNRSPYEYLPFSAGHHRCIGAEFATFEMKVVLAMLLQRYRLAVLPNARIDANLSMRPAHGLPMRIFPQDRHIERVPVRGNIHHLIEFPS
jgi:cytochrome P450